MLSPIDIKYFKLAVGNATKDSDTDIAVKCPICGDSKIHKNSKRLHLYQKNNITLVKCFNGGCEVNNNMYNFLKLYYPDLLSSYKNEMYTQKIKDFRPVNPVDFEADLVDTKLIEGLTKCDFLDSKSVSNSTNIADIKSQKEYSVITNLADGLNCDSLKSDASFKIFQNCDSLKSEANASFKIFQINSFLDPMSEATKDFLKSRKIINYSDFGDFFSGKSFTHNGKYYGISDFLVIPFYYKSNIYGFYSRSLAEKKFVTCCLNEGYSIWNYFNVDLNSDLYIFEGILDALSFYELYGIKNIIALNTSKISEARLNEIKKPIFCLDNDSTGIKSMLNYVKNPKVKVIIYPKNLECKDFNDILLKCPNFKPEFESGIKAFLKLKTLI